MEPWLPCHSRGLGSPPGLRKTGLDHPARWYHAAGEVVGQRGCQPVKVSGDLLADPTSEGCRRRAQTLYWRLKDNWDVADEAEIGMILLSVPGGPMANGLEYACTACRQSDCGPLCCTLDLRSWPGADRADGVACSVDTGSKNTGSKDHQGRANLAPDRSRLPDASRGAGDAGVTANG